MENESTKYPATSLEGNDVENPWQILHGCAEINDNLPPRDFPNREKIGKFFCPFVLSLTREHRSAFSDFAFDTLDHLVNWSKNLTLVFSKNLISHQLPRKNETGRAKISSLRFLPFLRGMLV